MRILRPFNIATLHKLPKAGSSTPHDHRFANDHAPLGMTKYKGMHAARLKPCPDTNLWIKVFAEVDG
jgi:hypothetical protein